MQFDISLLGLQVPGWYVWEEHQEYKLLCRLSLVIALGYPSPPRLGVDGKTPRRHPSYGTVNQQHINIAQCKKRNFLPRNLKNRLIGVKLK